MPHTDLPHSTTSDNALLTTELSCFKLELADNVAHLILNRPQALNTLGPRFWQELNWVLDQLHRHGEARALVISSTGKHFCAGMALETFADPGFAPNDRTPEGRAALVDMLADLQVSFNKMEALRMPVIAAVQGGCVGGGLDLIAAACIRYASADAFFCIQEINIGMTADLGSLQRLPKLMPLGIVKELAYTGRRMNAQEAASHGLVNAVHDTHEAAVLAALACAREIAAKPPIAIWGSKQAINYARDHSVADSLQQMGWVQSGIWSNRHVMEAVTAMQTKRDGDFPPLDPLRSFTPPAKD
ncbi:enoyl-CoA hydratase [Comamonas testosteroni]|uniref:Enoyl-CoA hydratase n=1 Tax=Comamonas testosteroni TaxID=285 RepID=A0A373FN03_COMTE|nr:enoyl-CoA hydratase-related protein [Comamonas testosteroni]RGE45297.1 enoyl-CoA hydratase [Comamonas testosteroni]